MPFHQTKHSPSHIGVVCQVAQNKWRSAVSHLLWMPSTSPVEKGFHVGILRPVGCSRWNALVEGKLYYFVYLYFVLHTWIMRGNERNPRKLVAEQMWYQRGYPELGRPCKLIAMTCQLRGKQAKAVNQTSWPHGAINPVNWARFTVNLS